MEQKTGIRKISFEISCPAMYIHRDTGSIRVVIVDDLE